MSSSELAGRSHRHQSDWLRALAVLIAIPLLVVAAVLIGGASPSQGASGSGHPDHSSTQASSTSESTTTTTTTAPAPTTTTTTAPLPIPTTVPASAPVTTVAAPPPAATPSVSAEPSGYGCPAALAYLAAHAAAGFTFVCPGYADGNEAMTCVNHAPECAGEHLIVIADPCPAAYMNEAFNSNSWSDVTDSFTQGIDPYGSC